MKDDLEFKDKEISNLNLKLNEIEDCQKFQKSKNISSNNFSDNEKNIERVIENLEVKIKENERELDNLKEFIKKKEIDFENLEKILNEKDREISSLKIDFSNLSEIPMKKEKSNEEKENIINLRININALEKDKAKYMKFISQISQELEILKNKFHLNNNENQEKINDLNGEIELYKNELNKKNLEINESRTIQLQLEDLLEEFKTKKNYSIDTNNKVIRYFFLCLSLFKINN